MSTNTPTAEKFDVSATSAITGPHTGYNKYGQIDHYYYRCTACGREIVTGVVADVGFEHAAKCPAAGR